MVKPKEGVIFIWLFIGTIALAAMVILWTYHNHFFIDLGYVNSSDPSDWGAFGDFFGGVINPIIGMATLVFVGLTLKFTREALHQNEIALKQAKVALKQGRDVIKQNADELKESRLEQEKARKAQQELAKIERENLDERRLLRDFEFCQKAEEQFLENINKIKAHEVAIDWVTPGAEDCKFTLGDLIDSHFKQIIFYDDSTQIRLAKLHQPIERFIQQLKPLYKLFERQNRLSLELDIVYSSKLKADVSRFNERIMGARIEDRYVPDSGAYLEDSPFFKDMLKDHKKLIKEYAEVLT